MTTLEKFGVDGIWASGALDHLLHLVSLLISRKRSNIGTHLKGDKYFNKCHQSSASENAKSNWLPHPKQTQRQPPPLLQQMSHNSQTPPLQLVHPQQPQPQPHPHSRSLSSPQLLLPPPHPACRLQLRQLPPQQQSQTPERMHSDCFVAFAHRRRSFRSARGALPQSPCSA